MENQTNAPGNSAVELDQLDHIPDEGAIQNPTPRWGFVLHRFNRSTGFLFNFEASGSLGSMMEHVKARYQEFLPRSWLRRFLSKIVVERATLDNGGTLVYPPPDDIESQKVPVQVKTSTKDAQLTNAFYNPSKFYDVPIENVEFAVLFWSAPTLSPPRAVVSLRTVTNKKRLFYLLSILMFMVIMLAGGITSAVSKDVQTVGIVVGVVMGIFCLFVATAAWLWKVV